MPPPPEVLQAFADQAERLAALDFAARAVQPGRPAPDVTLEGALGRRVALADLRAAGPVVVTFCNGDLGERADRETVLAAVATLG